MLEKDPTTFTGLTYMWVFLLAIVGGLVRFIRQCNKSNKRLSPITIVLRLIGELIISGFAGVLTFYLCEFYNVDGLLTAVLVGISGHLGGSAIDKMTKLLDAVTNKSI